MFYLAIYDLGIHETSLIDMINKDNKKWSWQEDCDGYFFLMYSPKSDYQYVIRDYLNTNNITYEVRF